jgi:hypothetical protein
LQALEGHPFQKRAQAALDELKPVVPDTTHWTRLGGDVAVTLGGWAKLTVDSVTGALSSLVVNGVEMAAGDKPLSLLRYQTLTDDDFQSELRDGYLRPGTGGEDEYGKSNCTAGQGCMSSLTAAKFGAAYVSPDQRLMAVRVTFANATLVNDYGAPAAVWLTFNATTHGQLGLTVTLVNKTLTRMPEAMYLTFNPRENTESKTGVWLQDKLGSTVCGCVVVCSRAWFCFFAFAMFAHWDTCFENGRPFKGRRTGCRARWRARPPGRVGLPSLQLEHRSGHTPSCFCVWVTNVLDALRRSPQFNTQRPCPSASLIRPWCATARLCTRSRCP